MVDEGATLHLEVEVDACPEPSVKWLRNGKEVSTDARIKISRDKKRHETYNLDVNLIKYEEGGEYEVVVTNALGTISSKSHVTVQSKYIQSSINFFDAAVSISSPYVFFANNPLKREEQRNFDCPL